MNHPDIGGHNVPEDFRKRIFNMRAERNALHGNFHLERTAPVDQILDKFDKAISIKENLFGKQPHHLYLKKAILLFESNDYSNALKFFREVYTGVIPIHDL